MAATQKFLWRHLCVQVDDIELHTTTSILTKITIPNKLFMQGNYPLIPSALLIDGIQCGFECAPSIVQSPSQGTLFFAGDGWWYKPNPGAIQQDSFTYKLSYMGQDSDIGTVFLYLNGYNPPPKTYIINVTSNNVLEGSSITVSVITTRVRNYTILYWDIESVIGVTSGDISPFSGSFFVVNNVASFDLNFNLDGIIEGAEQFKINLRTGSHTGPIVGTSEIITINDSGL